MNTLVPRGRPAYIQLLESGILHLDKRFLATDSRIYELTCGTIFDHGMSQMDTSIHEDNPVSPLTPLFLQCQIRLKVPTRDSQLHCNPSKIPTNRRRCRHYRRRLWRPDPTSCRRWKRPWNPSSESPWLAWEAPCWAFLRKENLNR